MAKAKVNEIVRLNDEDLKFYFDLPDFLKPYNKRKGEIRKSAILLGSGETENYVFTVETLEKETMVSKDVFIEKFGKDFLEKNGLIKTYTSSEVNVVKKNHHLGNSEEFL